MKGKIKFISIHKPNDTTAENSNMIGYLISRRMLLVTVITITYIPISNGIV